MGDVERRYREVRELEMARHVRALVHGAINATWFGPLAWLIEVILPLPSRAWNDEYLRRLDSGDELSPAEWRTALETAAVEYRDMMRHVIGAHVANAAQRHTRGLLLDAVAEIRADNPGWTDRDAVRLFLVETDGDFDARPPAEQKKVIEKWSRRLRRARRERKRLVLPRRLSER